MKEMRIGINKTNKWYNYLKPKQICFDRKNPIYQWLFFNIIFKEEEYQKMKVATTEQTCFIYCPECNKEMTSKSILEDTNFVYCKCEHCGTKSKWDFDAPCPILIPTNYKDGGDNNV